MVHPKLSHLLQHALLYIKPAHYFECQRLAAFAANRAILWEAQPKKSTFVTSRIAFIFNTSCFDFLQRRSLRATQEHSSNPLTSLSPTYLVLPGNAGEQPREGKGKSAFRRHAHKQRSPAPPPCNPDLLWVSPPKGQLAPPRGQKDGGRLRASALCK